MITRTLGPFHFEDLEPHRFEDLVRNLLYDFRDWRSLEPTGRGGADDGYDARGWERVPSYSFEAEQEAAEREEPDFVPIPPDERPWMIQCKREKSLGPSDVKRIVRECVSPQEPPYGFLLAAPVSFSKKSYDSFRDELRSLGVSEFYLWGKAEIEDMLLLPKNDRILFAFMGVSLVRRQRSRTTEVRSAVVIKNKLARSLNEGDFGTEFHRSVLVRDIGDESYPHQERLESPQHFLPWQEHIAVSLYPAALLFEIHKHFAYFDAGKAEYDVYTSADLIYRESITHEERQANFPHERSARQFHEHLPKRHRATFTTYGFIHYKDILLVDDKGDGLHKYPHIFVDMVRGKGVDGGRGPFSGTVSYLKLETGDEIRLDDNGPKRIRFFPEKFPDRTEPRQVSDRKLNLSRDQQWKLRDGGAIVFDVDEVLGELQTGDLIEVANLERGKDDRLWVEVIEVALMTPKRILDTFGVSSLERLSELVGRKVRASEKVRAIELKRSYKYTLAD